MPDLASIKVALLLLYKLSNATIDINLHPDKRACCIARRAVLRKVMRSRKGYRPQIMKVPPFPNIERLTYVIIIVIDVVVYEKWASFCDYRNFVISRFFTK